MEMILATKSSTPIIGQLATVMGWIMDGIYRLLNVFGIQNIGLCIIIFSILIYALMTPLQIKQQKFSKLSAIMQPELQKIQKKYKGKNDQASMQKMQEETQAVYQKYGVSPTGSCVQLAIQFPILMALYQVIYKIPAYVGSVKDILASAVTSITGVSGYTEILQQFITDNKMTRVQLVMDGSNATSNSVTDFLYALSPSQWKTLAETSQFSGFTDTLNSTAKEISHVQNFFGLNIAYTPWQVITNFFSGGTGTITMVIAAIAIPVLAGASQWYSTKLMTANQPKQVEENPTSDMMKSMNVTMPLMSVFFCFTFASGIGIYWVAQSVFTVIQQMVINSYLNKVDMDELVQKNVEKTNKKRAKKGLPPTKVGNVDDMLKKYEEKESREESARMAKIAKSKAQVEESNKYYNQDAKPGSLASKAGMVAKYNERQEKGNKK